MAQFYNRGAISIPASQMAIAISGLSLEDGTCNFESCLLSSSGLEAAEWPEKRDRP
jgi:hypothetical protein